MVIDWQDIAVTVVVAAATFWLTRGIWRWLRRRGAAGCTSCSGCASHAAPEAGGLVEIETTIGCDERSGPHQ
jgi:hypothetical protein